MQTVLKFLVVATLALQLSQAFADANDGELFGYSLGERYDEANDGELFGYSLGERYDEACKPLDDSSSLPSFVVSDAYKPNSIDIVLVTVTPVSNTVGKIAGETWFEAGEDAIVAYERFRSFLRQKYSEWETDERSEIHYQGSRFWSGDYVLSVQASGPHTNIPFYGVGRPFQLVISINYLPSTKPALEFEALANAEIKQVAADRFNEEDVRGL